MSPIVSGYRKKLLVLGLALLGLGLAVLVVQSFLSHAETLVSTSVSTTTKDSYYSDKFRAEAGYWLDLDLSSSGASTIRVDGQNVGEIFKVDGTVYQYRVPISDGDVYRVEVDNKAGHYNFFFWETDSNTISGDFYLRKTPAYLFALEAAGATFLIIGVAMVPSAVVLERESRRRAESLYECPRCHKKVRIGVTTCPYCKIDLTKYWVKCKYCGKLFDSHSGKCPKCGAESEI